MGILLMMNYCLHTDSLLVGFGGFSRSNVATDDVDVMIMVDFID